MQTQIDYVEDISLQETLNSTFGVNIFTVIMVDGEQKTFYLEYQDSVPQSTVNSAVELANQNAQSFLNNVKINLYEKLNSKTEKVIVLKEKPSFSDLEIQQAYNWLQNQQSIPPACVQFLALSKNISNLLAAQQIVDSSTQYENFVNQINTTKLTAQQNLMSATDIYSAKNIATLAIAEIKNLL